MTHTVENPASEAREVSFNLLLPDSAFVSRWLLLERCYDVCSGLRWSSVKKYSWPRRRKRKRHWRPTIRQLAKGNLLVINGLLCSSHETQKSVVDTTKALTVSSHRTRCLEREGHQPVQHFCKRRGGSQSRVPPSLRGAVAAALWSVQTFSNTKTKMTDLPKVCISTKPISIPHRRCLL